MEMWRRTGEGRLAEILGPRLSAAIGLPGFSSIAAPIDDTELTSYHPEGRRLLTAFANGVNAFIATHADSLPIEFVVTGIKPEPWTLETLTLRQVTFGDATSELQLARSVAQSGVDERQPPAQSRSMGRAAGPEGSRRVRDHRRRRRGDAGRRPALASSGGPACVSLACDAADRFTCAPG